MASSFPLLLLLLCSLIVAEARLRVFNMRATGLYYDPVGPSDGYVKGFCGSASLGQTSFRKDDPNPWWGEEFSYHNAQQSNILRLEVHDRDLQYDDLLGFCQVSITPGTHEHHCNLEKCGTFYFTYSLN